MAWAWEKGPEPIAVPQGVGSAPAVAAHPDEASAGVPVSGEDGHGQETLSVSEAVLLVKGKVAKIPELVVTGEVTGFRGPNARSGHCYFQVKDENAAMDVTMWRYVYRKLPFELRNGLMVQMSGSFQVYDKKGSLSFHISSMTVAGEGLLRQQVAELARRLEREGLMDTARKRPIPRFCERVCVVTSLSGAVIDDVRRTLARRNPLVEIQEVGCMVQGEGAAETIIRALGVAAAARPDAILLVRGGGSFEDLMTFNDEALARAVAACPVPVITGIGHEPDTSICDMVSDRRCSTPTGAAESVAPAIDEVEGVIQERRARLSRAMATMLSERSQRVETLGSSAARAMQVGLMRHGEQVASLAAHRCLQDPLAPLRDRQASLELSAERLHDAMPRILALQERRLDDMGPRLSGAMPRMLTLQQRRLGDTGLRLQTVGGRLVRPYEQQVERAAATLDALSPLRVLSRGYAVVRDAQGHVVARSSSLSKGDEVELMLGEGRARAEITEIVKDSE